MDTVTLSPSEASAEDGRSHDEDVWIEAEIERLLLQAQVDAEDRPVERSCTPAPDCQEKCAGDLSVDNLFSSYLSTLGSHQSDVQELISDAFTALNSATESLTKKPDQVVDAKEIIDLKISLEKQKGGTSNDLGTKEADEKGNTECSYQCDWGTDLKECEHVSILSPEVDQHKSEQADGEGGGGDDVHSLAMEACGATMDGGEKVEYSSMLGGAGEIADLQDVGNISEENTVDPLTSGERRDIGDLDSECDGLSAELLAVLEQVKKEQKACEEQLAKEQIDREAELISEIGKAQKEIAEYEKAKIERERVVEESRLKATTTLQANWRGFSVRRMYSDKLQLLKKQRRGRKLRAVQLLQAVWRGCLTRKQYIPLLEALRQEKMQREAKLRAQCTTRIQAVWKGYRARCIYGPVLSQLKEKRVHEMLRMKEELNKQLNAMASIIQATWRGHLVCRVYTPLLRERMERWREERCHKKSQAALRLQACWRGHSERQRTKRWLIEKRREKRALEEKRRRAACVLQAHWKMHCCKKRFIQQRKSRAKPSLPESDRTTSCSPRSSGRLTVSKRLESALSFKSAKVAAVVPSDFGTSTPTNSYTGSESQSGAADESGGGGLRNDGECEKMVQQEQQALSTLQTSRSRGESAAHQARINMSHAMGHWKAEKALQEKQSYSCYQRELNHFSTPVSPEMWLEIVQERLQQWFTSISPWKAPQQPVGGHPVPIPTARHQTAVKSLPHADLLAASPKGTPTNMVDQVVLDGCDVVPDVRSLSCCHQLCSLDLMHCGLSSVTSLPSNLPLAALNLQGNNLEQVDLQSVGTTLRFLDLSENRLGSIHGLEGCTNLLHLDISGNRITRLGDISHSWHLQSLSAESNLLVSCAGLETLPYLQTLSCAKNHLPLPPDVHNSSLLSALYLQQNNLQGVPHLPHHVVLRELKLEDNSLTDVSPLCRAWLPLLQTLSLARNCISQLDSLLPLIMLNTLDISNNSIYDMPILLNGLRGCMELQSLSLQGNPVSQEPQLHSLLVSVLPSLVSLNDEPLDHHLHHKKYVLPERVTSSPVYKLCGQQLFEQDKLKREHNAKTEVLKEAARDIPGGIRRFIDRRSEQSKEFEELLIRHVKEQEELGHCSLGGMCQKTFNKQALQESLAGNTDKQVLAAVVLQAAWRGHLARTSFAAGRGAAMAVQAWWRGVLARRSVQLMRSQHVWAATAIQAVYRGYWVRQRLRDVIQRAKYCNDEESSLEEDIDLDMNEDLFGDDFLPLSHPTPTLSPSTHCHSLTSHSSTTAARHSELHYAGEEPVVTEQDSAVDDFPPQQWQGGHTLGCQSMTGEVLAATTEKGVEVSERKETAGNWGPPTQAWTEVSQKTYSFGNLLSSSRSLCPISKHKVAKEKFVDEWGFKTNTTANLLMKRARRQKKIVIKAQHRKRMADPAERLAEFHRKGHSANTNPGPDRALSDQWREPTHPHHPLYQWHHDHTVVHKDIEKCTSGQLPRSSELPSKSSSMPSSSKCFLPQLDQRVLAGYAPALVAHDHNDGATKSSYKTPGADGYTDI